MNKYQFSLITLFLAGAVSASEATHKPTQPAGESSTEYEVVKDDSIYVIGTEDKAFLSPGSAQILSKEKVQEFQYSDATRVLQSVSGVYVQEEDGYGLRPNIGLRGATPHRSKKITLLEDGILIGPAPYAAPAAYFSPNMMKVEGLEVFKGPSSTKYGPNSIGGAINFLTNSIPFRPTSEVSVATGNINKLELSHGATRGKLGYLVEFNQGQSEGFKKLPSGENTGFDKKDLMLKAAVQPGKFQQKWEAKISLSQEVSHETYLGLSEDDFAKDPYARYAASQDDHLEWQHQQYQLRYTIAPRESVKLRVGVYNHLFDRNWSKLNGFADGTTLAERLDPNSVNYDPQYHRIVRGESDSSMPSGDDQLLIGNNDRKYSSQGIYFGSELLFTQGSETFHTVQLGLRFHTDSVERNHTIDTVRMVSGDLQSAGVSRKDGTFNKDTAEALTFSLEDEIDFSNGWLVSVGFRTEDVYTLREPIKNSATKVQSSQHSLFAPGVGVQYSPSDTVNYVAGVNKGVSVVGPGQGSGVLPEESLNYEAGVKFRGDLEGEVIGFFSDYSNIKGFCSFSSGCDEKSLDTEFNGGRAEIYGLESRIAKKFQISKVTLPVSLSYTKTVARFQSAVDSNNPEWGTGTINPGDPMPYIPEDKVSLSVGSKFRSLTGTMIYNWQGPVYDQAVAAGRKKILSHKVIDLIGKYSYSKQGEFFLKVDNLFAEEFVASLKPFGARPGKPQTFSAGLRHVF